MGRFPKYVAVALGLLALVACGPDEVAEVPKPVDLTLDATGHFCNMTIMDHPGPKAHAFVKGGAEPFWFTSARDAIAFSLLPESANRVSVIYVTDMATVANWTDTTKGKWINARSAWYVIESSKRGGMGAAEAVPFGNEISARNFMENFGGQVVNYTDVPRKYVLDADQTSGLANQLSTHEGKMN
jgi:copper chaperone NosL